MSKEEWAKRLRRLSSEAVLFNNNGLAAILFYLSEAVVTGDEERIARVLYDGNKKMQDTTNFWEERL